MGCGGARLWNSELGALSGAGAGAGLNAPIKDGLDVIQFGRVELAIELEQCEASLLLGEPLVLQRAW